MVGAGFLVVGMFIGRPYCRFLCPYGALLKLGGHLAKWRVRVTPDVCTQCRLCEASCPFGAMREPTASPISPRSLPAERKRLAGLLLLLPVLVGLGAWTGSQLSRPASRVHPTVALADQFLRHQESPIQAGQQTPQALALKRATENPQAVVSVAADLRRRFLTAGWIFGGWVGLVIGLKLIGLSVRQKRTDYEPDRGACVACARCFAYCPNELQRLGLVPPAPVQLSDNPGPVPTPDASSANLSR
jgi:NosR/NirI family nitrous oxide reductase transcriptional regulator